MIKRLLGYSLFITVRGFPLRQMRSCLFLLLTSSYVIITRYSKPFLLTALRIKMRRGSRHKQLKPTLTKKHTRTVALRAVRGTYYTRLVYLP